MTPCQHPLWRQMYRAVYDKDMAPLSESLVAAALGMPTPNWVYKEDYCMDCGVVLRTAGDESQRPESWK